MRTWALAFALTLVAPFAPARPAHAGEVTKGKVLLDWWDVAFLEGVHAGHVHTRVEELIRDGVTYHYAAVELRLTVKRFKDPIHIGMDTGTVETAAGKVVGTVMRQILGKGKELLITGLVKDRLLHLSEDGKRPLKPAPWRDDVVGLFRQQLLFQEKNVQPGDRFTFPSFEPSVNLVLMQDVEVKDYEEVELFGGKEKARLLRVEITPPQDRGGEAFHPQGLGQGGPPAPALAVRNPRPGQGGPVPHHEGQRPGPGAGGEAAGHRGQPVRPPEKGSGPPPRRDRRPLPHHRQGRRRPGYHVLPGRASGGQGGQGERAGAGSEGGCGRGRGEGARAGIPRKLLLHRQRRRAGQGPGARRGGQGD